MNEKQFAAESLANALNGLLNTEQVFDLLEKPKKIELGDIAFPAFSLAKELHKSPVEIAKDLAEKIDTANFDKIEAAGPYVNFFVSKTDTTAAVISDIVNKKDSFGSQDLGHNGNVTIDMSAPNIAKPFSIGHLRSTVLGESISNLYKKLGYNTIKINHLGDWGKQFGLLITAYEKYGDEAVITANPIDELLKLYVKINAEAKEDPAIDEAGRAWFLKMEQGDEEALRIWKWFSDVSLIEFNRIYDKLGVTFDFFTGESFYSDKMDAIADDLDKKGLLHESRGALVVNLDKYNLNPALIKKTDGATLYITRDLATAVYRKKTFDFVKSLYVVGAEQINHFKQLKAVLKEAGYDWSDDMTHIPFGMVTQGGKKFSTREGHVVKLEMALDEAVERALQMINDKNPDLPNKEKVAHQVGIGAVTFYDLKTDRMNGYDFDLEEMVSFEGETGPYVQYAHARIQSILRKAAFDPAVEQLVHFSGNEHWELVKHLQEFPATIKRAADKFEPSVVAKYAIVLAQAFNRYYAQVRILEDDAEKDSRLTLIYAVSVVLKEALRLLGVQAPEEM
ncbi:MAG: arginine--tRNA ligase [Streptococcaceae bacterium]|jgi:arginyl-tRNA synthetase|nr:arginine--tRNA ligase [Streptococcaceae bacterium]